MISAQLLWIIAGCVLAAYLLALSGIPTYLRREALTGDALSHAIFPGVVLSVWILTAILLASKSAAIHPSAIHPL
jgi:ABC-type Mn2+/Zn2+ transport system permease subunit